MFVIPDPVGKGYFPILTWQQAFKSVFLARSFSLFLPRPLNCGPLTVQSQSPTPCPCPAMGCAAALYYQSKPARAGALRFL